MRYIFIFLLTAVFYTTLHGQVQIKKIDLALSGTTNTFTIPPGKYLFSIENIAPAGNYEGISIIVVDENISAIDNGSSLSMDTKELSTIVRFDAANPCKLDTLLDDINIIDSEKKVIQFWNNIDFNIYNCNPQNEKDFISKFKVLTTWLSDTVTVRKGQKIVVTIKKLVGEETGTRTWTYETPIRGAWLTSYGFNFISRMFSEEQHYFTSSDPGDTTYTINAERDPEKISPAASIMFSWVPNKHQKLPLVFSAGLGADTEDLSVFAGGAFVINYNVYLNFGMAGHYQWDLLGKYKEEGEKVLEDLDFSQLHDKEFAFNPYVGISFRFADNPFENKDE